MRREHSFALASIFDSGGDALNGDRADSFIGVSQAAREEISVCSGARLGEDRKAGGFPLRMRRVQKNRVQSARAGVVRIKRPAFTRRKNRQRHGELVTTGF